MLRALLERGIVPDLVLGTSVGAINGAAVCADPSAAGVQRLDRPVVGARSQRRLRRVRCCGARRRSHARAPTCTPTTRCAPGSTAALADRRIEELAVPFQCVAASIERACEHWFADGPLVDAVLASAAVPGLLPPVEIGGEHFIDGGIVNSIPVSRAVALGAQRIFVLHVGRLDRPLEPPRWPWEVGARGLRGRAPPPLPRRPRGAAATDIEVHVLPTGQQDPPRYTDLSQLRYRDMSERARAHRAGARGDGALPRTSTASGRRRDRRPAEARAACRPRAARRARRARDPDRRRRCSRCVAAIASPLTGGAWRPLRVVAITVDWAARHLLGMLACLGLWVAGGFGLRAGSARVRRRAPRRAAPLRRRRQPRGDAPARASRCTSATSERPKRRCRRRERPVVVLSRHAGEGDSLLVLHALLCRYGRRPRVVLHEALRLDPLIDVLGHRLAYRFIDPRGGDIEDEIAAMASDLGDDGAVLIFPEGGNFSRRAARARHRAPRASRPRRGGRAGARDGARRRAAAGRGARGDRGRARTPTSSSSGTSGIPAGVRDLWRVLLAPRTVELRMWHVAARGGAGRIATSRSTGCSAGGARSTLGRRAQSVGRRSARPGARRPTPSRLACASPNSASSSDRERHERQRQRGDDRVAAAQRGVVLQRVVEPRRHARQSG